MKVVYKNNLPYHAALWTGHNVGALEALGATFQGINYMGGEACINTPNERFVVAPGSWLLKDYMGFFSVATTPRFNEEFKDHPMVVHSDDELPTWIQELILMAKDEGYDLRVHDES